MLKQFSQPLSLRHCSCLLAVIPVTDECEFGHAEISPHPSRAWEQLCRVTGAESRTSTLRMIYHRALEIWSWEISSSGSSASDSYPSTSQGMLSIVQRLPLGTEVLVGGHWRVTAAGALALVPPLEASCAQPSRAFVLFGLQVFGSGVLHPSKNDISVIFPSPCLLWSIFDVFGQENMELEKQQGLSWLFLCFQVLSCFLCEQPLLCSQSL